MNFDTSPLMLEVKAIMESGSKPVHYEWKAVIQVMPSDDPSKDGDRQQAATGTFEVLKVIQVDILRDYAGGKYSEEAFIRVLLGGGTYARHVYPAQNNLVISLYQYPLNEIGDISDINRPARAVSYRAVLKDTGNPEVQQQTQQPLSTNEMDLANQLEIEFQLVDYSVEVLRTVMLNTVARQTTVKDVLSSLLSESCRNLNMRGGNAVQGVTMAEPNNKAQYEQIVIPVGTRLIGLPDYIQREYGVYSAGMGFFYQDSYWYLWPQFHTGKFEGAFNPVTVIMAPSKRMPGNERTFRVDGDACTILATGESHYRESSEAQQLEDGVGLRFVDGRRVMENFGSAEGGKLTADRAGSSSEVAAITRPNGVGFSPYTEKVITANPYAEYAKLAQRDGNIISLTWENSDINLLKPGTAMRIMFCGAERIETLEGILMKAHHFVYMDGKGMATRRHRSTTALFVYVKRATRDNASD